MTRRLTRIAPLQTGKIAGILYGLLSLLFIPFFIIAAVAGFFAESGETSSGAAGLMAGGMVLMALVLPVLYAAMGFIGGVICAAVYNFIARWVGGLEFEVEDVPVASPPTPVLPT
jgi:hypothetical protein